MRKLPSNILKTAEPGKYSDGGGLFLHISGRDEKGKPRGYWVWRYSCNGRRREMGIGPIAQLGLKAAREMRDEQAFEMKRTGIDPLDAKMAREAAERQKQEVLTLDELAPLAYDAIKENLKGEGNAGRWYSPVRLHILPKLGKMKIEEIHQTDIAEALKGLWLTKYPTAKKALDRLNVIFNHAAAMGLDVNLSVVPHAKILLGAPKHTEKKHPALPVDEARRLYQSLDILKNVDRALMLYLLLGGGARVKPLREAHEREFLGDIWIVDGDAMKGRKGANREPFRVPLSSEAMRVVNAAKADCSSGFIFSTARRGGSKTNMPERVPVVSDQVMENIMRDREVEWGWPEPCRLHGIRSTFRTWAADKNPHIYAISETALGHKVGTNLERTYQRSDFLEARRELLNDWAAYLVGS